MTAPVVTFFDNRGGAGKTTLVYHLACAYRIITDPARDEALARLRAEMARETRGQM